MSRKSVMLHDTRLRGTYTFPGYDHVRRVNQWSSLSWAMNWVRRYALRNGGIDALGIACHGYEDTVEDRISRTSITIGGYGLELCRDGLDLWNVAITHRLHGLVEKIIVYACSTADRHPDPAHAAYIGDYVDGQRLMAELAHYTGARVYAADATQYSEPLPGNRWGLGDWYGNVYEFDPETGEGEIIQSYPVE